VLREILSADDGEQRPALSTLFSPERAVFGADPDRWPDPPDAASVVAALPVPQVDTTDPAAGLLATSAVTDPTAVIASLSSAPLNTLEVRLRIARARIEQGDLHGANKDLDDLAATDPGDWRVTWYRGLVALVAGRPSDARNHFDLIYGWLPGEQAAKLALAVAEETAGNLNGAAKYYESVWRTDHGYVSAAFGLARLLGRAGRWTEAVDVLDDVPAGLTQYVPAQIAAIRARLEPGQLARTTVTDAAGRLARLRMDLERQAMVSVEVLTAALALVANRDADSDGQQVLGYELDEYHVRLGLEEAYRELAKVTRNRDRRSALVDQANHVRPKTLV